MVSIDNGVESLINQRKNDFYSTYSYLKPNCEKTWYEFAGDAFLLVGAWCIENWWTALKIIVVVLLVTASIILLCTGVGGILAAIAWGVIIGAAVGGLGGGIYSKINGGSFWEGFANGALIGAAIGAVLFGTAAGIWILAYPALTSFASTTFTFTFGGNMFALALPSGYFTAGSVATVTGAQILQGTLIGLGVIGAGLMLMGKNDPRGHHPNPVTGTNKDIGFEALKRNNGNVDKAVKDILNRIRGEGALKKGTGTEYNKIRKWLQDLQKSLK